MFLLAWCRTPGIVYLLFIARTALMNCGKPLMRAVLMDSVPRHQRGRWNSVESIFSFSFSGSAMVGGWLIDNYSYAACFYVTAFTYLISTALLLFVVQLDDLL